MVKQNSGKGFEMEEHLRHYFNKSGYYVVRGVPFNFGESDATDIDLWVYGRSSSFSRNVSVVDIKNKKQPKAMERLFWVSGLKKAVNADHAIIATTDKRELVKEFGEKLDVLVLDGHFLNKLKNSHGDTRGRMTEEKFYCLFDLDELAKLDGDWKAKVVYAKSLFARGISYDNCNALLEDANFFANKILHTTSRADLASRCFYLVCSYFAISVDYLLKNVAFLDSTPRVNELQNGFTYGATGKKGTQTVIEGALQIIEQYDDNKSVSISRVREQIEHDISGLQTSILAEYFAKPEVFKKLFNIAKELELAAYNEFTVGFDNLSTELRGYIYCLLDYWEIDRATFSKRIKAL